MSQESVNSLPGVDSDVRITESGLNGKSSSSTSVQGVQPSGETEGLMSCNSPVKLIDGRQMMSESDNLLDVDDDSVQEVTWVVSKLDIFKSTSSSRKKAEEITDFYKTKLYKSGVMLEKPQQIFHRDTPADGGFRLGADPDISWDLKTRMYLLASAFDAKASSDVQFTSLYRAILALR